VVQKIFSGPTSPSPAFHHLHPATALRYRCSGNIEPYYSTGRPFGGLGSGCKGSCGGENCLIQKEPYLARCLASRFHKVRKGGKGTKQQSVDNHFATPKNTG